jgi:hypothetical protein
MTILTMLSAIGLITSKITEQCRILEIDEQIEDRSGDVLIKLWLLSNKNLVLRQYTYNRSPRGIKFTRSGKWAGV